MTRLMTGLLSNAIMLVALGATYAAHAECQQGGWLDEHPKSAPDQKWQGVVSQASLNGFHHYSARWSSVDGSGGRSERDLDIILSGTDRITIKELQSNQSWIGQYEKAGDYYYFTAEGFQTNTGKPLDYEGIGCFRVV